ncbi:dynein regulatory complex protein 8 isoform X1 [Kogia breviceps]|uniref:dynein regulatory complex protein 8 isoform X1 n=1 Tax=Kogia breviceps TaxID=27615 RepID=UPI0034D2A38A
MALVSSRAGPVFRPSSSSRPPCSPSLWERVASTGREKTRGQRVFFLRGSEPPILQGRVAAGLQGARTPRPSLATGPSPATAPQQNGGRRRQGRHREIGTIIRSLGCCPSEGELHDLIAEVEEEEPTGYIRFEKFLPVMTEVLLERRYRPIPEDILHRAFEVLDPAKRGFLSKEELIKYMTEEGEPFSQEEMEEMLSAAVDPESNSIHYKDYVTMMVIDEN